MHTSNITSSFSHCAHSVKLAEIPRAARLYPERPRSASRKIRVGDPRGTRLELVRWLSLWPQVQAAKDLDSGFAAEKEAAVAYVARGHLSKVRLQES